MRSESIWLIAVEDIRVIRIECQKRHAAVTFQLDETVQPTALLLQLRISVGFSGRQGDQRGQQVGGDAQVMEANARRGGRRRMTVALEMRSPNQTRTASGEDA
jgi:hypothetical protein